MAQEGPKKIAVLGGGIASLTAVAELTKEKDWQSKYDITVYQMGWRLGGKGASGRSREHYDRIEEHGYHMWFGFYDLAFRMLQSIYEENARPLEIPLATWSEAFKPVNYWVTAEKVGDHYENWPLEFQPNRLTPGQDLPRPSFIELSARALHFCRPLFKSLHQTASYSIDDDDWTTEEFYRKPPWPLQPTIELLMADLRGFIKGVLGRWLYGVLGWLKRVAFSKSIEKLQAAIERNVEHDREARRMWILSDFIGANLFGILFDGVLFKNSFDVINDWDYRKWLKHHGATEFTLRSPLVQGFYALVFSGTYYSFEAGTALRATLELLLNYKGSVYWKMQAGMGEVVFAPIYEVLKRRGVKFKFFHRVTHLQPASDGNSIASIEIHRQVTLKQEYDPLISVRGLPCWPSEPLYDQIVEGPQLNDRKINLESSWSTWQDVETITLEAGRDFDQVVLGISINALPAICPEIIAARPEWKRMLHHVKAIPTMGVQLWMHPDIAGLGSPMWRNEICLVSTYVEPCDTWADKSDLIARESWPDAHSPNSIAYITGPMEKDFKLEPFSDPTFPCRAACVVKGYTRDFLQKSARYLWPEWVDPHSKEPRWQLLVDPEYRGGEERLNAQYFRANIDPTEHYVLTVKGSSKFRLRADQSGYDNMVLTGDWTKNPLNCGCIEAAVMSGILAAQTVQKQPLLLDHNPVGPFSFMRARKKGVTKP